MVVETSLQKKWTAAELASMPDEKHFELVDGKLIEKVSDFISSWVAAKLGSFLNRFGNMEFGCVLGADAGYQCFAPDLDRIRRPDVSYTVPERIPPNADELMYIPFPPDLAVEVISHNDLAQEMDNKVTEYLAAGVRLVWVIYPISGRVLVYSSKGGKILTKADELSGEDVIPGFQLKISELLRMPSE